MLLRPHTEPFYPTANSVKFFLPILMLIVASCLAACGGGSGSNEQSAAGASPIATVAAAESINANYSNNQVTYNSTVQVAAASPQSVSAATRFNVSEEDNKLIGPFKSWANAKTDYGAKGDGVTDDTAALQAALNNLGKRGNAYVLYLPAGNYKISKTLNFTASDYYQGAEIIGQDPSNTTISWVGPTGGVMLLVNGGANTRLSRLTWNGNKSAGYGVAHWWNRTSNPLYGAGSVEHSDEVFEDMNVGIMAGRLGASYGDLDSEGQIRRVTFLRETQAGVEIGSWNAANWWVWDSHFVDCARGVTNNFSLDDSGATLGAGGVYVYRSYFERSTVADVNITNTGWFSVHDSVSIGSRRFFQAEQRGGNAASVILQGNRIVYTTDPISIYNANLGLVSLIDNQILSKSGTLGPVVKMDDNAMGLGRDLLSIGNSFTVTTPISGLEPKLDRLVSIGDKVVSSSDILATGPSLPKTPSWSVQQVFEVPVGATAAQIQAVINNAAASGAVNPVVHFPPGRYQLDKTLVVPPATRITLAGDGWGAELRVPDSFPSSIIKLAGPSYATVQDLALVGGVGNSISITSADQAGGRILVIGSLFTPISATNLNQTQLEFQANPAIKAVTFDGVKSAVFIGTGGLGPVNLSNSNALISDSWYEGTDAALFRMGSSTFTYMGGIMSPADINHTDVSSTDVPIKLDGFHGTATFLGFEMNLTGISSGVGIEVDNESSATNAMFIGVRARNTNYFKRTSTGGTVGLYLSRQPNASNASVEVPNVGSSDTTSVLQSLSQARSLAWDHEPYVAPSGTTDVRIYRVRSNQSGKGLAVTP